MIDRDTALNLRGGNVIDNDGERVGTIEDVYLDEETDQPEWVAVKTGLFGTRLSFVPLAEASQEGGDVRVPYDKDMIKGAPNVEPDGQLSQGEEAELYRYYGLSYSEASSDTRLPECGRAPSEGYDVSAPTTDDAMTRSEDDVRVRKAQRAAGRAPLRKDVVTGDVTDTVAVRRE